MAALLELRSLTKSFGGLLALDGISFKVEAGKILSIIGPNGAGKTTLFNVITGAIPPDSGDVLLEGQSIKGLKPNQTAQLGIGRTFQIVRPFPGLTTLDNVALAALAKARTRREARRRAEEILEITRLSPFANLESRNLTLGRRKRLEIARAMALEPRIILLDEVMAGLTPAEVDETVALIKDLSSMGISAVAGVEHVMQAVRKISDWIVALNFGRWLAEGPPRGGHAERRGYPRIPWKPLRPGQGVRRVTEPILRVRNLVVFYGDAQAIWDVSLHVDPGELVVLLGANGAGKTTTIRAISGILRPAGGSVEFRGAPIHGLSSSRIVERGIGHVPEGRALFPQMTVRENLLLGAYLPGPYRRRRENLDRVFSFFPLLKERERQLAGTLSGGQQQMCAIGRGIMSEPSLLMLDEPSTGLAPLLVEEIFQIIADIRKEGVTVLLVEQHIERALELADRAFVLADGKTVGAGTGAELLANEDVRKAYLSV